MTIGETIRMARLAKGMSLQKLATITDISIATMSKIEKDKDVSLRVLKRVCNELGLEIFVKFKETNENEKSDFIETADIEELEVVEP